MNFMKTVIQQEASKAKYSGIRRFLCAVCSAILRSYDVCVVLIIGESESTLKVDHW